MLIHGHYKNNKYTPTYKTWLSMKQRCNNPHAPNYALYGGRGIKICKEWNDNFIAFLSDMGERPKGTSLDRINSNGDYCKENCRWATPKEQSMNLRTTYIIEYNGEVDSVHGWSERLGVSYSVIKYNHKHGLPLDKKRRDETLYGKKYKNRTVKEWADILGVKYFTLVRYVRLHGFEAAIDFYGSRGAL